MLSGLLAISYLRTPPERPEMRLPINSPSTTEAFSFALSPDGQRLAFVADEPARAGCGCYGLRRGEQSPWPARKEPPIRSGRQTASRSRSLPAGAERLDLGSGLPRQLAKVVAPRGGSWSADGVILYAPTVLGPLWQVSDSGGEPNTRTKLEPAGPGGHLFPQFLPGGRRFLFYVRGNPNDAGIHLGSLGSEKATRLTAAETAGAYLSPGRLLFVRDGALVARLFDTSAENSAATGNNSHPGWVGPAYARWSILDRGVQ